MEKNVKRLLSFLIISIFSTIICSGAGYTLKVVSENETNWTYLASISVPRASVLGSNTSQTESPPSSHVADKVCANVEKYPNHTTTSVVDYLYAQGDDYSFAHRSQLASKYGIENYTGSLDQNKILIKKLQEQLIACK